MSGDIVYGVVVTLPKNPSWTVLQERLEKFENMNQADQGTKSVLISKTDKDSMTKEEIALVNEVYDGESLQEWFESGAGAKSALNKILGEENGFELKAYTGGDYYVGRLETVLLLEYANSRVANPLSGYGAVVKNLNLPFIRNAEIDEKLSRALGTLGLEAGEPGWKFVATNSKS